MLPVGGGQNLGPEMMLEDAIICPESDPSSEQELLVVLKLKLRHDGNSWQAIWQSGKLNARGALYNSNRCGLGPTVGG